MTAMARPREFDELEALDQATKVFWTHGYNGTSLVDLTNAMGISKSSFYDTFGGKRDLYLKTLDYYIENNNDRIGSILNEEGPPLDLIDRWLQQAIDGLVSGDVRRGCFLNNCAVEDGPHDPEVAAKAREGFYAVKRKLAAIIACGQVSGEINRQYRAESHAAFLVNAFNGISAMGKCDPDPEQLGDVKDLVLSALGPERD